jgi:urea transport system permease protein
VVIGGVGQIKGTVIAAFVLGVVQSWVEFTTTASSAQVIVFALIVAFLQVRPQGIYQVRTRSLA